MNVVEVVGSTEVVAISLTTAGVRRHPRLSDRGVTRQPEGAVAMAFQACRPENIAHRPYEHR